MSAIGFRGLGLPGTALAVALALTTAPALADDTKPDARPDDEPTLADVWAELSDLREENERLRVEMDELKAETSDNWLTERRAEEIRTLVADVLADSDSRASTLQSGMMAGWSEHFFLASPDGRFKLQLDGQLQARFVYNFMDDPDRHRAGFEITRTKLTARGHVFSPDLTYLVRTDQTRNEPGLVEGLFFVRDAWVALRLNNQWSMRFGQFKLPFNREELVSSSYQLAVERSLVNESYNLGRSEGFELTYADDTAKFTIAYSDGAVDSIGGFGLLGANRVNSAALLEDTEYAVALRMERLFAGEWRQFVDFTSPMGDEYGVLFGIGAHAEKTESNGINSRGNRNETTWSSLTADLSIEWGGATMFMAVLYHWVDTPTVNLATWGSVVQYGMYLSPKWEIFGRWEYGWLDTDAASFSNLSVITIGANYYIDGHDAKWTTDLSIGIDAVDQPWDFDIAGFRQDQANSEPQFVFRTQFQLLF